jgi:hypothetical protein
VAGRTRSAQSPHFFRHGIFALAGGSGELIDGLAKSSALLTDRRTLFPDGRKRPRITLQILLARPLRPHRSVLKCGQRPKVIGMRLRYRCEGKGGSRQNNQLLHHHHPLND